MQIILQQDIDFPLNIILNEWNYYFNYTGCLFSKLIYLIYVCIIHNTLFLDLNGKINYSEHS